MFLWKCEKALFRINDNWMNQSNELFNFETAWNEKKDNWLMRSQKNSFPHFENCFKSWPWHQARSWASTFLLLLIIYSSKNRSRVSISDYPNEEGQSKISYVPSLDTKRENVFTLLLWNRLGCTRWHTWRTRDLHEWLRCGRFVHQTSLGGSLRPTTMVNNNINEP